MTNYRAQPTPPVSAGLAFPVASLDAARERAIRLLTDGFAYDTITVEEFEYRLAQMTHASSPQAIDALVADLAAPPNGPSQSAPNLAVAIPTEGRILSVMSATRRVGPWRVPPSMLVKAIMSEVKVDLRYAVVPPGCTIDVSAIMANVAFIVPPGLIVDFDVTPLMGSARSDPRASGRDVYVQPHLRILGSAIMAEVRVKVRELGR
jgi:hypothetical protein